jgi:non-homologous end joining protein Ku
MRAKECLAIVRVRDDVLPLTTMLFADEVRPIKDVGSARQKSHKPTAKHEAAEQPDAVSDLMDALEKSLASVRGS